MVATITVVYWINVTNLRLLLINPLKIQEVATTSAVANVDLLGELKCLFCTKIDTQENLIEAGTKYATKKKVNVSHANETTIKWHYMALALSKTEIASKLSLGDLASNELFYYRSCLTEFHNDFNVLTECERSALHGAGLHLCAKLLTLSTRKTERNQGHLSQLKILKSNT